MEGIVIVDYFNQLNLALETALNAELDEHLGYEKHQPSDSTSRGNGYTSKSLRTEDGQFELDTPRDREGRFEPQLVKKQQTLTAPHEFTSIHHVLVRVHEGAAQWT